MLPPRIAPVKAVIIPISTSDEKIDKELMPKAAELKAALNEALGGRFVNVDTQFHMRPGDRFFSHLQKGVPLRLELGEKEYAAEKLRVVRRDTGEKIDITWADAPTAIPAPLQSDTVFCITKLSPACQPHATFAEVISGMTFSSFPIL